MAELKEGLIVILSSFRRRKNNFSKKISLEITIIFQYHILPENLDQMKKMAGTIFL